MRWRAVAGFKGRGTTAALGKYASAAQRHFRSIIRHAIVQIGLSLGALLVAVALLLLPLWATLPIEFTLGAWAPFPRFAASLAYRYDALSHLFAFLAAVSVLAIVLSPETWSKLSRAGLLLALAATIAFVHATATVDLLAFYVGWELCGWAGWLLMRGRSTRNAPLAAYFAGLALLAAIILLAGANGGSLLASTLRPEQVSLTALALVLLAALVRGGQFPFQNWLSWCSRAPQAVIAALLGGALATGGPYLLLRAMQLSSGHWPVAWARVSLTYLLAAVLILSLLAWRSAHRGRALTYALGADLGLVMVTTVIGTPAALSAGLLLLVNNSLALVAMLAAGASWSAGGSRPLPLFVHIRRLLVVVAAASLVGAPPLLGFTVRWQLLAGLWDSAWLGPLLVLGVASLPRTIAMLRAVQPFLAGEPAAGVRPASQASLLSGAAVPAALVAAFSLVPWLPLRYLVAPALAVVGAGAVGEGTGLLPDFDSRAAAGIAALLVVVPALAVAYDDKARRFFWLAGEVFAIPAPFAEVLQALGSASRLFALGLLNPAERTFRLVRHLGRRTSGGLTSAAEPWLRGIEERYYLAITLLLAMVLTLAFVG